MAENTEIEVTATKEEAPKIAKLKNLSAKRCVPTEFVSQTCKIKKAVEKWLKNTDIVSAFKKEADLIKISDDMTEDEKKKAFNKNKEISSEFIKERALAIFDAVFEKDPQGTLEILALSCFTEPEDVDKNTMADYFEALYEMLNDKYVIDFFISFITLGHKNT